eukprot:gb/GFBE01001457.1/.p1 GENE.gb/GFBE01001457.1/~~gb/GFBE01001457.1/.p1  ORF type:complete len:401 (+),score=84.25 gb/GFBE01001457.1/:1-1203(+)
MALSLLLLRKCPTPDSADAAMGASDLDDCDAFLVPRGGRRIPCHSVLLLARCPSLGISPGCTESVDEEEAVVFGLLRWVYCEAFDLRGTHSVRGIGDRVVCLAETWGMRDVAVLRERLVQSWRTQRRKGSLDKDLLRAYDARQLGSLEFSCADSSQQVANGSQVVYGGWPVLLRAASSYFHAMLNGSWAESSNCDEARVRVHWPSQQLSKLVRYVHGGHFVSGSADLHTAVECGEFFGVPALIASANDWIAENLDLSNAATLWGFVEGEPRMRAQWLRNAEDPDYLPWMDLAADADEACFDFHIREFASMAQDPENGDGSWVPLHDLSPRLMHRLVSSGLISMNTEQLKEAIERYARAKCSCPGEFTALAKSLLPPTVLFNRELRDLLLVGRDGSIRSVL